MARKSNYELRLEAVRKRIEEMAPENCDTIEEAVRNDQKLADMNLASGSTAKDYSYCPTCSKPMYRGNCQKCN